MMRFGAIAEIEKPIQPAWPDLDLSNDASGARAWGREDHGIMGNMKR